MAWKHKWAVVGIAGALSVALIYLSLSHRLRSRRQYTAPDGSESKSKNRKLAEAVWWDMSSVERGNMLESLGLPTGRSYDEFLGLPDDVKQMLEANADKLPMKKHYGKVIDPVERYEIIEKLQEKYNRAGGPSMIPGDIIIFSCKKTPSSTILTGR